MIRRHKTLLVVTTVLNAAYIIWLAFNVRGPLGVLLFVAEAAVSSLSFLLLFNHWTQKHKAHSTSSFAPTVDVFITVVNEPLKIFEPVLASLGAIDYAKKTIYVLDDGARPSVRDLAAKYGATYLTRPDKPLDYKAGNLNYGLAHSTGEYILVIDADQKVTNPAILKELMGHFREDEGLAMLATRQKFDVPKLDFNHDTLFYEHMQTGKNDDNAAISSGSGVIYSRAALEKIGGIQTWNVVEDLYTAYVLHQAGFKTLYINKAYTLGTAPLDLAAIYKQRGTWALDTLRLFFWQNPFFKKTLDWRQKFHYCELALAYLISAFAVSTLFILPIFTLHYHVLVIAHPVAYVIFRVPSLVAILWLYYRLSDDTFSTSQFWASLFPVYAKAAVLALLPGKPKYKVTPKVGSGKRDTLLALPHIVLLLAAAYVTVEYVRTYGVDTFLAVHLVWFVLMAFWFYPIIRKALVKE